MLFDGTAAPLPVATLRAKQPRDGATRIAGTLRAWLSASFAWFRPRTVPVLAAMFGAVAVIAAARYLADMPVPAQPHAIGADLMKAPPVVHVHAR